jgi:hypothetical protein
MTVINELKEFIEKDVAFLNRLDCSGSSDATIRYYDGKRNVYESILAKIKELESKYDNNRRA